MKAIKERIYLLMDEERLLTNKGYKLNNTDEP